MHQRKPNQDDTPLLLSNFEQEQNKYMSNNNARRFKTILLIIFILIFLVWFFNSSYNPNKSESLLTTSLSSSLEESFYWFAFLLTSPNQKLESSFGWYQDQLENFNLLGRTQFQDTIMTRLGFQDTQVTSKEWFHYFRTFNVKEQCTSQHSAQIYPLKTAGEYIRKDGIKLDAVLHHLKYEPPFYVDSIDEQQKIVEYLHAAISIRPNIKSASSALEHSTLIDKLFGEKIWRGMRRLTIFMGSEAILAENIEKLIQKTNDIESMKRFAQSTADLSVCFQRSCSVWVNYLYSKIEIEKSGNFGTKPLTKNKGVCAFISNCDKGSIASYRHAILRKLSEYVPIRQYGNCGRNVEEGSGGKQFELENNCRFYFAAENSITKDYVTEKLFDGIRALKSGAKLLIIYMGAPNIREFGFPSSMFMKMDEFETVDQLGRYLQQLDSDEAFESRFFEMKRDITKIDQAVNSMGSRLAANIPCRILKAIGQMKLARYLLFKIGLNPANNKVNQLEWNEFKQSFASLGRERLEILDRIYYLAYGIFYKEGNYQNLFNLGWPNDEPNFE